MHAEALQWLTDTVDTRGLHTARWVLDIGGRNVNGTARGLFPHARYVVLDQLDGPDVDIVDDAAGWTPDLAYDVVVCTEVLEHTEQWRSILATMTNATRRGGALLVTAAADPREPHSLHDGGPLRPGEPYGNIAADELVDVLVGLGFRDYSVTYDPQHGDVYAVAHKP